MDTAAAAAIVDQYLQDAGQGWLAWPCPPWRMARHRHSLVQMNVQNRREMIVLAREGEREREGEGGGGGEGDGEGEGEGEEGGRARARLNEFLATTDVNDSKCCLNTDGEKAESDAQGINLKMRAVKDRKMLCGGTGISFREPQPPPGAAQAT